MCGREKNHNPFLLEHQIRKGYKKCSMKTGFSVRLSSDWVFDLYRIQCSRLSGFYIMALCISRYQYSILIGIKKAYYFIRLTPIIKPDIHSLLTCVGHFI